MRPSEGIAQGCAREARHTSAEQTYDTVGDVAAVAGDLATDRAALHVVPRDRCRLPRTRRFWTGAQRCALI